MGADVAESFPDVVALYDRAAGVLGFDIATYCFEGPAERLEQTDIQQPAIFVTSVAMWQAWLAAGGDRGQVQCMGGLSLGEYTALYAANAIDFDDAVRLVHGRGRLMQQAAKATPSGMVTLIGADESTANELCARARAGDEVLAPANFNCPGQIVVSGSKPACERAVEIASEFGCKAIPLPVAGAFHSSLMSSAAEGLADLLHRVEIRTPEIPVISNVDGSYHKTADSIRTYLRRQVTEPVRWQDCVERMIRDGARRFVEIGPGRVLSNMMRKIDRRIPSVSMNSAESIGATTAVPSSD